MRAFLILAAALLAAPAAAADLTLGLPIACTPGADCWVQQYVDHDPSAGAADYACGPQSYDGHDGTDIRLRDTAAIAAVVAAADGVVKATRDGVADHLVRSDADRKAVAERECGNGVVLTHPGGWETQYCHLREGTIAVRRGMRVKAGQRLGDVGYSGAAAFPHLHLSVRHDGASVDPFRPAAAATCGGMESALWDDAAASALPYQHGAILGGGFAPGAVALPDLEEGKGPAADVIPGTDWAAVVAYAWAINLEAHDEVVVTLTGPDGIKAENHAVLDRAKAQYLLFAGRKRPAAGWPRGRYTARVEVRNGGETRFERVWEAGID